MTVPVITAFYGGLLGVLCIVLAVLVINQRRISHIGIGDGGNQPLARMARVFGNFAEYTALALLLFVLLEVLGGPPLVVHLCAGGFVIGRIAHAFGLSRNSGESVGRALGVGLTFAPILVAAVWLVVITATKL